MTVKRMKQLEDKGIPMVPITHPIEFDLESTEEYLEQMKLRHGRDPED